MGKFEEMSRNGKCDVCGEDTKVVVCASSMGAISYSYCEDCLRKGLEPYNGIIAYISCAGNFPNDINPSYVEEVRRMLRELGKTEEEFIQDCDKANEKMMEWYKSIEENEEE